MQEGGRVRSSVVQSSVWLMACDAPEPALRQRCLAVLSESERARYAGHGDPGPRDRFLLGRAMLRVMLSRVVPNVEPGAWRFQADEHGRPYVAFPVLPSPVYFNLTHTRGLLALIVGGVDEVGIDAECLERARSIEELAAHYFAPGEQAWIHGAAPAQRRASFFEIWTLREAYAKARGLGLALPLSSYRFVLEGDHCRLECDVRCEDDPGRWQFHRFRPTPQHVVAVAQAGEPAGGWPPAVGWLTPAELLTELTGAR